jgi:hypothetical protein
MLLQQVRPSMAAYLGFNESKKNLRGKEFSLKSKLLELVLREDLCRCWILRVALHRIFLKNPLDVFGRLIVEKLHHHLKLLQSDKTSARDLEMV